MTLTNDKITSIPRTDLPLLRDLFLQDWPKHIIGYDLVYNYMRWFEQDPKFDEAQFFSLNGDWRSDGTFIVIDKHECFAYTLDNTPELDRLTRLVKLLPKDRPYQWASILQQHAKVFEKLFKDFKLTFNVVCRLYHLPQSKAVAFQNITPPKGIVLRELSYDDIPHIDGIWPHHQENSSYLFARRIKFNTHLGEYDEVTGELLGWCLRYESGILNALQVEEHKKRKGFGDLLVRAMSRKIGEQGEDVTACIIESNIPSIRLFEKDGFRYIGEDIVWMRFEPENNNYICEE